MSHFYPSNSIYSFVFYFWVREFYNIYIFLLIPNTIKIRVYLVREVCTGLFQPQSYTIHIYTPLGRYILHLSPLNKKKKTFTTAQSVFFFFNIIYFLNVN